MHYILSVYRIYDHLYSYLHILCVTIKQGTLRTLHFEWKCPQIPNIGHLSVIQMCLLICHSTKAHIYLKFV